MLLESKNAVIYGAAGSIGSAVARAFAREGARVFLAGRTRSKLEAVAGNITRAGGRAEAAEVDAFDRASIEAHLDSVVQTAGRVAVSFNAVWIRCNLQGTPLLQMTPENFTTPVLAGVRTHFLTATAAARHMVAARSGVLLTLSSSASALPGRDRRHHLTGGFATACAAVEALTYSLAGELGPQGIRVVCLRPNALPETWPTQDSEEPNHKYMRGGTALDRLPTLEQVADAAVFAASDRAGALTGTVLNLSCGSVMA